MDKCEDGTERSPRSPRSPRRMGFVMRNPVSAETEEDMEEIYRNHYTMKVPYEIIWAIGLQPTMILMTHIGYQESYGDKYNDRIRKRIHLMYGIASKQQKAIEDKLISFGFMKREKKPMTNQNEYTIYSKEILQFFNVIADDSGYIDACRNAGFIRESPDYWSR